MASQDILFHSKDGIFSYRVSGILIRDGKVLLQHVIDDPTYAFPGGHVNFGEIGQDALIREFKEEIAADVKPLRLLWIGENFFPWGEKDCHQICLYYQVVLCDDSQIPLEGHFSAQDDIGGKKIGLEFYWFPMASLENIDIAPAICKGKLQNLSDQVEAFVYIEKQ